MTVEADWCCVTIILVLRKHYTKIFYRDVVVLDYWSEGCELESQVHQTTTASPLSKDLNPQ